MNDGLQLFISLAFLAAVAFLLIIAAIAVPIIAVGAVPLVGAYIWLQKWRHSEKAPPNTERLYLEAKRSIADVDITAILDQHRDIPEATLSPAIGTWFAEGYDVSVKEPPAAATPIELGRYRDTLTKQQHAEAAFSRVIEIAALVHTHLRWSEELEAKVLELLAAPHEGTQLFPLTLRTPIEHTPLVSWRRHTRSFTIPEKMRTQHHHIVGGTGSGKTELIKHLVMQDVRAGHSVIVVDSQTDLIDWLAPRVPNPLLVDPIHCPPPLNLFAVDAPAALFEYIFQALDAEMTAKQSTAYRYVSRMVVAANGNIHTMRRILQPGDEWERYTDTLSDTARSFFETEFASRQFAETRQQIHRRLFQVLENELFEQMVGAPVNKVDIAGAIRTGRPVLISTAKDTLQQQGASLFGRIFIAQVMQAAMSGTRKRTYLYLDEFQDYAEDSPVLFNLFEQARKFELGMIVAHQYLGQLPTQLQQSIAANTAIKMVGGVSAEDARKLSTQMFTEPAFLTVPQGTFAMYVKGMGTVHYPVTLDTSPPQQSLSSVRAAMRKEFAVPIKSEPEPEPPEIGQVPERGEW